MTNTNPSFRLTQNNDAKSLKQAMESEIRLLRYWVLQTLKNYKSWRNEMIAHGELPVKKIANMRNQVTGIVAKTMSEYRRKQSLLKNLAQKESYFNDREIQYYRIENHFGAAMAAMFANDN